MGKVLDEAEEEAQMGGLLVVCRVTAPLSHLLGSLHGEEFLVRQVVGRDHEEFRDDCRGRLNQSQGGKVGGEAFSLRRHSWQVKFNHTAAAAGGGKGK